MGDYNVATEAGSVTTLEGDCSKFDVESKPRFAKYIFDELDIFFDF